MDWRNLRDEVRGSGPDTAAMHVLERLKIRSFPTPVYEIASRLGSIVKIESCEGMEGGLEWKDPPIMYINALNNETRRRFTCAHEIGHLILHPMEDRLDETKIGGMEFDPTEISANRFAAHLLMPLWALGAAARHLKDVGSIMRQFGVSAAALNWQLDLLR